jgi:hypothetical protein
MTSLAAHLCGTARASPAATGSSRAQRSSLFTTARVNVTKTKNKFARRLTTPRASGGGEEIWDPDEQRRINENKSWRRTDSPNDAWVRRRHSTQSMLHKQDGLVIFWFFGKVK